MNSFYAMVLRLKYINRWGLMRNTRNETLSEHSLDVAVLAHALGTIRNKRFGGNVNTERLALLAIFHDVPEIITGDLPTPVKYFNSDMRSIYGEIERNASEKLLSMLPEDIAEDYTPLLIAQEEDAELWPIIKAADKLSALIKCIEEQQMGNHEFDSASKATMESIQKMNMPEVDCFINEFMPAFSLTLDEQS